MKLVSVVGARPQFIKLAVLARALQAQESAGLDVRHRIVHTGQHYDVDMSAVFFKEMEIPPPHLNLGVQASGHGAMTGKMLQALEPVLAAEDPDIVIVYGDTNSTLAGALAAAKLALPVAHVEAGLRSYNRRMPEEINRILSDHVADLLFCPTRQAVENLRREGFADDKIHQVGDVMLDAVLHYGGKPEVLNATAELRRRYPQGFRLATVHRAENTDDVERLAGIFAGLERLAEEDAVVIPLHPRTRQALKRAGIVPRGIDIVEPVGYFEMLALLKSCRAVLTDSGGLQKEAYFFGKPCITLRDETEWVELVACGSSRLAGADSGRIVAAVQELERTARHVPQPLYGEGDAGVRIAELLMRGRAWR
jgi:UDP-GlcNAc3NAcA epimerase